MTETITGILTDYQLMTEGEHAGRYAARIDDKPYPIMPHVDAFLVRLQMKVPVDVTLNKDGWISKITPAKKSPIKHAETERTKEEITAEQDAYNAKKEKAGFSTPTEAPQETQKDPCTSPKDPVAAVSVTHPAPAITFNESQLTLMRAKVAPNCTQTEFELLMYMANKYQLDPLIRQIWAIKYEGKPALIFAGRDGFLEIAHRSGHFDGMKSDCVYDEKGALVSAWCEIWRNDMTHSFRSSVLLSEYTTVMNLWKSKPSVMLIKCAESVCLRKAFSVSGLYAPEEVGE